MSPHQIIAVAVRLFAVWLALEALQAAVAFLIPPGDLPPTAIAAAILFVPVAALIVALLWRFPQTIARKLLSSSAAEPASTASPDSWMAMGCALIGLWIISYALPALIRDTLIWSLYTSNSGGLPRELLIRLLDLAARVFIALWLIFGANGFRRLFWWARNAGHRGAL